MTNDLSDYQIIVAPAADNVAELRGCDVYRVVENCWENFSGSITGFIGWLEAQRPDLKPRIDAALDELTATWRLVR